MSRCLPPCTLPERLGVHRQCDEMKHDVREGVGDDAGGQGHQTWEHLLVSEHGHVDSCLLTWTGGIAVCTEFTVEVLHSNSAIPGYSYVYNQCCVFVIIIVIYIIILFFLPKSRKISMVVMTKMTMIIIM